MKHFRNKTCWGGNFFLLLKILLFIGFISYSNPHTALAQTEIPLEGQSAIIEKSLRQSIPPKTPPQDPRKSKTTLLNEGRMHASDFAALIAPSANNNGLVLAKLGTVRMVSGEATTVDFVGNDLILFAVSQPVKGKVLDENGNTINDQVLNTRFLQAKAKKVILTARDASSIIQNVINMKGMMKANKVTKKQGCIFLEDVAKTRSNQSINGMPCF